MIQEIFLKKALQIHKDYQTTKYNINFWEKKLKDFLRIIELKQAEFDDLKEKLENNQISSDDDLKDKTLKIIIDFENEVNNYEKETSVMNSKIEDLKKQELKLYRDIRQRYPELNDEMIKSEIYDYLKKNKITPR